GRQLTGTAASSGRIALFASRILGGLAPIGPSDAASDAGVPLYFVSTPSTKKNNSGAVSGVGVGTLFTAIRLNYPNKSLNYSSAIHLTSPSGDKKKGFSTGHATWNLANHIERAFGDFSPFLEAGVGNTVM